MLNDLNEGPKWEEGKTVEFGFCELKMPFLFINIVWVCEYKGRYTGAW